MDSEILQSLASIASFLAGFFTAVFAEPFRQWLSRPRLHLTFRPEFGEGTGYVSRTPEKDGTEEISYYEHRPRTRLVMSRRTAEHFY